MKLNLKVSEGHLSLLSTHCLFLKIKYVVLKLSGYGGHSFLFLSIHILSCSYLSSGSIFHKLGQTHS